MTSYDLSLMLSFAEPVVIGVAWSAFVKRGLLSRFPVLRIYLAWQFFSAVAKAGLNYSHYAFPWDAGSSYYLYRYADIASFLVSSGIVVFAIQELFASLLAPLPGLRRLGLAAFRWFALSSFIFAVASILLSLGDASHNLLVNFPSGLMRSISLIELGLLVFLGMSLRIFGFSPRSHIFGIGLGFTLIAGSGLLPSTLALLHFSPASPAVLTQVEQAAGLLVWIGYFLVPDEERRPITLPISSPLLKWNEVALALGHPAPQVALPESRDLFLDGVEKVVDRILKRNSVNAAG